MHKHQERTSFVIELDQMIERHAPAKKTARRAATKARTAAVTKPQDDAGPMDDNVLAGGSALYGSGDEPGRSNSSEESVEGPLRDWPDDASSADRGYEEGSGQNRSGRNS